MMTETTSSSWQGRQRGSKRCSGQPRTPKGAVAAVLTSADAPAALYLGARAAAVSPMAAAAQTGADVPAAGLTEIAAFTGGALSRPGQVPWSPWDPGHCQGCRSQRWVAYPHEDQLRRVGHGDEGTAPGVAHVGGSLIRRHRLLRGSMGAGCPHCCSPVRDTILAF
jgi:hypothetical protein